MNWKPILFGGALLGGAVLLIRSITNGIDYKFTGIKWLGFSGLKLRFALIYTLSNQNDIPATVTKFNGKLSYGTYKLSDVVIGEERAVTIQPGGTEPMDVRFSVSPGALIGEITKYLEDKSGIKRFNLGGWMSGKIGDVPFIVRFKEDLTLAD